MSRLIKEKMIAEYAEALKDVTDVAVVSTEGVDVKTMTALRGTFRQKGLHTMRVQNRLGRRALADSPLASLDPLLVGPSTLVWGGDGIVDIAKALTGEAGKTENIALRGGVSGGQLLSQEDLEALSALPSREELIGMAVGMAIGQAGRLVAAVQAMGGRVASQIREYEKQAPGGGAESSAPAEGPAEETKEEAEADKAPAGDEASPEGDAASGPENE